MNQHNNNEHPPAGPIWDEANARWYVQNFGDHPTNRKAVELAQLQPEDRVLDIGCGSGPAVRAAAALLTAGAITGVDPTPAMVKIARELTVGTPYAGRITFREGPAEKLPFPDATFTVALAVNSVNHWNDLAIGMAEAFRVLAPAGRLLVVDEWIPGAAKEEDSMNMDPAIVAAALRTAGFDQVTVSTHPVAGEMMSLVQGQKPA